MKRTRNDRENIKNRKDVKREQTESSIKCKTRYNKMLENWIPGLNIEYDT